jgi:hypothetical protein
MKSSKPTGRAPVAPSKKKRPSTGAPKTSNDFVITNSRNSKPLINKAISSKSQVKPSNTSPPTISDAFRSLLDKNAMIIQQWFRDTIRLKTARREQVSLILQTHKNLRVRSSSPKKASVAVGVTKNIKKQPVGYESAAEATVIMRRESKAKAARDVPVCQD